MVHLMLGKQERAEIADAVQCVSALPELGLASAARQHPQLLDVQLALLQPFTQTRNLALRCGEGHRLPDGCHQLPLNTSHPCELRPLEPLTCCKYLGGGRRKFCPLAQSTATQNTFTRRKMDGPQRQHLLMESIKTRTYTTDQ